MGGNKGKTLPSQVRGQVRIVKKKAKATAPTKPKPRDKPKRKPAVVLAPCYFCDKKVDEKEYLCAGCDTVVCDACEGDSPPMGNHHVESHRPEPKDDD
jgi:hypothetical protein